MSRNSIWVFVAFVLVLAGCSQSSGDTVSVLFVGNSFTFGNDVPGVVEEVAEANGVDVDVEMIATGGRFFDEHASDGPTMAAVGSGDFDIVVLQEQSMAPSHAQTLRDRSMPGVQQLASSAQAGGSRVVLFQTWGHIGGNDIVGHESYESMQAALIEGYHAMSRTTGTEVAPVGERWQESLSELPAVVLYNSDGVHSSSAGAYLAAVTIADTILTEPLTEFPGVGLDDETAQLLGHVATS